MSFSWIKLIFQLGLLIISLAHSEVLLHRLDYEISHHPKRSNVVGTVTHLPNSNCGRNDQLNDPIIELFHSPENACINLERNFWRNVERYCPNIIEQYDHFNKNHFQYPMNLRILAYNLDMIYVTFDIIGDSPKLYGNWWRIYLVDKSYHYHSNGVGFDYDKQDNMIELTGRVVDHWNGTYSVFFGIPIINFNSHTESNKIMFTLDMTLDYLACSGFAEPLIPWKNLHRKVSYVGDFAMRLKLDVYINNTASSPQCTVDDKSNTRLLTAQYLCDTGYYSSNVWIPSKSTHLCSEHKTPSKLHTGSLSASPPILKNSVDFDTTKENKLIMFVGDSTTGQVGRCFLFQKAQKGSCGNEQQCQRLAYSTELCKNLAFSSRYNDTWKSLGSGEVVIDGMQVEGARTSSNLILHLKNRIVNNEGKKDIHQFTELVVVMNIGLHEMKEFPWPSQKAHLRSLITTLTSEEMKSSFPIPLRIIWRSTWSLHEYCYQRNNYWFREDSILKSYTTAEAVVRLRDPTVWLHHSYILDVLYNTSAPGNVTYLDNYWLSKARVKRYSAENRQNDIRHHDMMVVRASIETTLDSMF